MSSPQAQLGPRRWAPDGTRGPPRGVEGIVRHARALNPEVDVVLMHFVDPGKTRTIRAGGTAEVIARHEAVAEAYGLPSLDLAREVTRRMDAGQFTWADDFP